VVLEVHSSSNPACSIVSLLKPSSPTQVLASASPLLPRVLAAQSTFGAVKFAAMNLNATLWPVST
jgi:hypothetical protein